MGHRFGPLVQLFGFLLRHFFLSDCLSWQPPISLIKPRHGVVRVVNPFALFGLAEKVAKALLFEILRSLVSFLRQVAYV